MRTPLCDLVGIDAPIALAPMGGAVTPRLAAAVSSAGGLGMLPLTWTSPDDIASIVEETRQQTERPFGVNLGLAWDQRERLAAALGAGVRVVSFFWGDASGVIGEGGGGGAPAGGRGGGGRSFSSRSVPRRKDERPPLPVPTWSWRRAGKPAGMSGDP